MKNIKKKKKIRICNLIVKYLSLQFCALEKHTEIINIKVKRIITFRIRKSTNRSLNSKKSHTQKINPNVCICRNHQTKGRQLVPTLYRGYNDKNIRSLNHHHYLQEMNEVHPPTCL